MQVFTVANFKGGTGKSTTSASLADIWSGWGYRVLVIDTDPQHNISDLFGWNGDGVTLTDVLCGRAADWRAALFPSDREGPELIPADMGLLELDLAGLSGGTRPIVQAFGDLLDAARRTDACDMVVIDCPPLFTAASMGALLYADTVVIPLRVDAASRSGAGELVAQTRSLREGAGMQPPVFRPLLTMTDRSRLCRQTEAALRELWPSMLRSTVRASVRAGESTWAGQSVWRWAPGSTTALDYQEVAGELLEDWRRGEAGHGKEI